MSCKKSGARSKPTFSLWVITRNRAEGDFAFVCFPVAEFYRHAFVA
jgi:hypothetical protein